MEQLADQNNFKYKMIENYPLRYFYEEPHDVSIAFCVSATEHSVLYTINVTDT